MTKTKAIGVLLLCSILYACQGCSITYTPRRKGPNSDNSKTREVELIWSSLPIYPGMSEIEDDDVGRTSTGIQASISKHFNSNARYEEVKQFYIEKLSQEGWQFVGEQRLTGRGSDQGETELHFRKGEYSVVITYVGKNSRYTYQYGVDVAWHNP